MTQSFEKITLTFGSELPTAEGPDLAARAAKLAAEKASAEEAWCDSEAPTHVEVERPLFPRPPRAPRM